MTLFLRNGVTTIRELNGSPELLALRERIRTGVVNGPIGQVAIQPGGRTPGLVLLRASRSARDANRRFGDVRVVGVATLPASGFDRPSRDRSRDDFESPRSRFIVQAKRAGVAALKRNGVRIILGADLPNPGIVAGYSVHDELAALVRGGMSTFAAIASAIHDAVSP